MSLEDRVEGWVDDALDEAAEEVAEALDDEELAAMPLGAIAALRPHTKGIAAAGALGLSRLAVHVAAGDMDEARHEALRSMGHKARRAARRRARLAAAAERDERDVAIGALVDALEEIGSFALTQALPFLLRALAPEELAL